jgi:beta-glucosidase
MNTPNRILALAALGTLALVSCDPVPSFDPDVIAATDIGAELARVQPGFILGAATSHHQIEGGLDNDWTEWEKQTVDGEPTIKNGDDSSVAADSWNRWPEDVAALETLGANGYRMGISWSRLQPSPDAWDQAAADRYRDMFTALNDRGIRPMVTIYHFTLPRWVADEGGWEWDGAPAAFEDFARRAGEAFGDQIDWWVTLNEPNVLAIQAYSFGAWAPGVKDDMVRATNVYAGQLRGHALASAALRAADTTDADGDGEATQIGIAHHVRLPQPASSYALDTALAAATNDYINDVVPRAITTGRLFLEVPGSITIDEQVPNMEGSCDWLGINYYERTYIRADLSVATLSTQYQAEGAETTDLGWEVSPESLYHLLIRMDRYGLPLYITENGLADDDDDQRASYLRSHLYAVYRAIEDGADVKGYLHWALIDNFEWAEGYEGLFGLFSIDFGGSLDRVPRPNAVPAFQEITSALNAE